MKKLVLLNLCLMLGACFGGGQSIPQDQFYRLAPVSYDGARLQPIAKVIAVSPLESDGLYRERAILYSQADTPLKLQRYHYYHWTYIPPKLIQDHLVDYLRTTGIAGQVSRYGQQTNINAEIGGEIKRFERVIGASQISVVVELELFYKTRGSNAIFYQHAYKNEVVVSTDSMHATAEAFSQALLVIYNQFVKDISKPAAS